MRITRDIVFYSHVITLPYGAFSEATEICKEPEVENRRKHESLPYERNQARGEYLEIHVNREKTFFNYVTFGQFNFPIAEIQELVTTLHPTFWYLSRNSLRKLLGDNLKDFKKDSKDN